MVQQESAQHTELLAAEHPGLPGFLMSLRAHRSARRSFIGLARCDVGGLYHALRTYQFLQSFNCYQHAQAKLRAHKPALKRLHRQLLSSVKTVRRMQEPGPLSFVKRLDTELAKVAYGVETVLYALSILANPKGPFRAEAYLSAAILHVEQRLGRQCYGELSNILAVIAAVQGGESELDAEAIRKRHTRYVATGKWALDQVAGAWAGVLDIPRVRELGELIMRTVAPPAPDGTEQKTLHC